MGIKELISQMTLEEKAALCSGKNLWETQDIERLGIPSITLTDGPYGVVKRLKGFGDAVPSTCFPTPSAMASSWDEELIYLIGKAIGEECQAEEVSILLGPGVNIQRSPLGGRNFEYYSEDPMLSGRIGTAFVKGVQNQGIGACVKHYAVNNQEYHRTNINNIVDERTLKEIYLPAFEKMIKEGRPWAVMAAYNKLNGEHCTENKELLTDILREEYNFKGFTVSDWYAVDSIVNSLKDGLNLEMPYSYGIDSKKIVDAVLNGILDEEVLNSSLEKLLNIIFKAAESKKIGIAYNKKKHNELARVAASNCIVLLKNENNILPIKRRGRKKRRIAIIGEYAKNPRYQGGGSAHVNPTMVEIPYDEIIKIAGNSLKISYARGYDFINKDENLLINEAKLVAKSCDIVILFVGAPESYDEEGHDRTDIDLPQNQVRLIEEISKVQKNIVVVLNNGSPIIVKPWCQYTKAIVEGWLTGQASGGAIADVLFGITNPSGKLSSTFPIQLSDNPAYLDYVGPENNLQYKEGIFVGYRYYDKKDIEVQFPFGHGLSYTSFEYKDLKLSSNKLNENGILEVSLKVKNTGKYFGKEVVQLYVRDVESTIPRPIKELKAFKKVSLKVNEEKGISFLLGKRDFAFYDVVTKKWVVEGGMYEILIGTSSRDICLAENVYIESSYKPVIVYNRDTLIGDFYNDVKAKKIMEPLLNKYVSEIESNEIKQKELLSVFKGFPVRVLVTLSKGYFTEQMLEKILEILNK